MDESDYIGISTKARKIFKKLAKSHKDNINIELDFGALAVYCEALVRLEKYNAESENYEMIVESRNGETYVHPIQKLIDGERNTINKFGAQLGFTPMSRKRSRMEAGNDGERDKSQAPEDEFLK